jgi:hypothetical protein
MMRKAKSAIEHAVRGIRAGDENLAMNDPRLACDGVLAVESSEFTNGDVLPRSATADGDNMSPQISWSGEPEGTREVVLLCEDPDAPMTKPFVHWLLHGIDPTVHAVDEKLEEPGSVRRGMNSGLHSEYVGAAPPPGHGTHHYHFEVFAVDQPIDVSDDCTVTAQRSP